MRTATLIDGLELISHVPESKSRSLPLLFVHGAFVGAWCWDEHFLPYFAQHGYEAHAISLRAHGGSAGRDDLWLASIADYEADVLAAARHIGRPLVVIGHSMGGMVVQRCVARMQAVAAVLMASVPPEGLFRSSLLLAARDPELLREISLVQSAHPGFTATQRVRRMVFSDDVPEADAIRYFMKMQPESQRAVFDLSWPQQLFVRNSDNLPVLALGGGKDEFFPVDMIESTARFYGVTAEIFPRMAHAMMLSRGWEAVAARIRSWLDDMVAVDGDIRHTHQ